VLENLPLFQGFSPTQLSLLRDITEEYWCDAGQKVLAQGDPATYLYIMLSGEVALQYKPHDGPQLTVTHLFAGDAFGWSAAIGAPVYTLSILAVAPVRALRVSGAALRALTGAEPELGRQVLERLAKLVSSRWKHADQDAKATLETALLRARSSN